MSLSETLLQEFEFESAATRKLLERLPDDKMSWKPHDKSMDLARLASHVAEIPQWAAVIVDQDEFDVGDPGNATPQVPQSGAEVLEIFHKNADLFIGILKGKTDEVLFQNWTFKNGDTVLSNMPRIVALRSFIFNHIIHHRGQLTVYLRLTDVALPAIYGPSADENPFA